MRTFSLSSAGWMVRIIQDLEHFPRLYLSMSPWRHGEMVPRVKIEFRDISCCGWQALF